MNHAHTLPSTHLEDSFCLNSVRQFSSIWHYQFIVYYLLVSMFLHFLCWFIATYITETPSPRHQRTYAIMTQYVKYFLVLFLLNV
jgi:hypothetical protein